MQAVRCCADLLAGAVGKWIGSDEYLECVELFMDLSKVEECVNRKGRIEGCGW